MRLTLSNSHLSPLFLTPRPRVQILHPTPHFASVGASCLMLPSDKIAPASVSAGFAEQPTQQGGLSASPVCVVTPHHPPEARSATPVQCTIMAPTSPTGCQVAFSAVASVLRPRVESVHQDSNPGGRRLVPELLCPTAAARRSMRYC